MGWIPTGVVRGSAEQWLVHGVYTVSPARPHVKKGPRKDEAVAGILSITGKGVQIKVPADTLT